jgi:hypothetical protein
MLQGILHWVSIAAQVGNSIATVDGLLPPKIGAVVAGGVAVLQYVLHLLDPNAPSIGATPAEKAK